MSKPLKPRRGTTAEHASFIGLAHEVTYDTDKHTLVTHDGVTPGGFPLAKEADVEALNTIREDTLAAAQQATASGGSGETGSVTLEGVAAEVARLDAEVGTLWDPDTQGLDLNGARVFWEPESKAAVVQAYDGANYGGAVWIYAKDAPSYAGEVRVVPRATDGSAAPVTRFTADGKILNGECPIVIESWKSGSSWYRKFSDGWVQQGGYVPLLDATTGTVTFPVPFKDTTYNLQVCLITSSTSLDFTVRGMGAVSRTATSFVYYTYGRTWRAEGYFE